VPDDRVDREEPLELTILLPSLNEENGVRKVLRTIPRTFLGQMGLDVAVQLKLK